MAITTFNCDGEIRGVSQMTLCPLCKSSATRRLDLPHTTTWKCCAPGCGLEFANPQLSDDELAQAYTALYYPADGDEREIRFENTADDTFRQMFQRLEKRIGSLRGLRLLDYGCGRGALLRVSLEFGMRPVGIEQDAEARAVAIKVPGAEVHQSIDTLQMDDPNPQFDLVILWTVVEHLRNPWAQLARLRTLLRSSGWLLMSTMDIRCLRARIERAQWENYQNPTHLYYFDRVSLSRAIQEAGFAEFSEWKVKISFPHHGALRRWLYGITFVLGMADGLYYLCRGRAQPDGREDVNPAERQIRPVFAGRLRPSGTSESDRGIE